MSLHRGQAMMPARAIAVACILSATMPALNAQELRPGSGAPAGTALRAEIETVVRDYIQRNPQDIREIVRDYLANNPEMLQQILADAIRKQRPATAPDRGAPNSAAKAALIRENAARLFSSPHQVTLGNPTGDVTLVEFFDYSCGYCKRALADKLELLKTDPKLRLVLKDLPILGPNSVDAARIAIAVRMQDPSATRSLAYHTKLLGDRLPPSRERALDAAREAGADMARLRPPP